MNREGDLGSLYGIFWMRNEPCGLEMLNAKVSVHHLALVVHDGAKAGDDLFVAGDVHERDAGVATDHLDDSCHALERAE